jgi:hypothetical protein
MGLTHLKQVGSHADGEVSGLNVQEAARAPTARRRSCCGREFPADGFVPLGGDGVELA